MFSGLARLFYGGVVGKMQKAEFKYPFSTGLVILSLFMVIITTIFSIVLLYVDIFALILYFVCTIILTAIFFVVKFYLYFIRGVKSFDTSGELPKPSTEADKRKLVRNIRWTLVFLLMISFLSFLLAIGILQIAGPVLGLVLISSFVVAINLSEILLFLYSNSKSKSGEI